MFVKDDGGRGAAGFSGSTRDCVTRAIAIASQRPYAEVYEGAAAREKIHWARCLASPNDYAPTKNCKCRHCKNQRRWYGKFRPDIFRQWMRDGRA